MRATAPFRQSNSPPREVRRSRQAVASRLSAGTFGRFSSFGQSLARLVQVTGSKAQVVGTDTVAGRKADIVSLQDHSGAQIRVWIDHQHPFILKWQQADSGQVLTPGSFSMNVTSIHYGNTIPPSSLRVSLPKDAANLHRQICVYSCSSAVSGSNSSWDSGLFPGYIRIPAPVYLDASSRRLLQVYLFGETFMLATAPPAISYGPTSYG
jgi:hypothetical protein